MLSKMLLSSDGGQDLDVCDIDWPVFEKDTGCGFHTPEQTRLLARKMRFSSSPKLWCTTVALPLTVAEFFAPDLTQCFEMFEVRTYVLMVMLLSLIRDLLAIASTRRMLSNKIIEKVAKQTKLEPPDLSYQGRWHPAVAVASTSTMIGILHMIGWDNLSMRCVVLAVSFCISGTLQTPSSFTKFLAASLSNARIKQLWHEIDRGKKSGELVPQFLSLRRDLEGIWNASDACFGLEVLTDVLLMVLMILLSFAFIQKEPVVSIVLVLMAGGNAWMILYALHHLVCTTDAVMSTGPHGLHGALLLRSESVYCVSDDTGKNQEHILDALALAQMQHILAVTKVGAKLGVVVDWPLLFTVAASSAASILSVFKQAVSKIMEQ